VQAEEVGEHGGGEPCREIDEGGAAPGSGGDAERAEAVGQPCGGDRPSGQQAGEQPFAAGRCSDAGVWLAVR
jgi:hypothetical protein